MFCGWLVVCGVFGQVLGQKFGFGFDGCGGIFGYVMFDDILFCVGFFCCGQDFGEIQYVFVQGFEVFFVGSFVFGGVVFGVDGEDVVIELVQIFDWIKFVMCYLCQIQFGDYIIVCGLYYYFKCGFVVYIDYFEIMVVIVKLYVGGLKFVGYGVQFLFQCGLVCGIGWVCFGFQMWYDDCVIVDCFVEGDDVLQIVVQIVDLCMG